MRIEHIGLLVANPIKMGRWYRDHLGFRIIREIGTDSEGVIFMEDDSGLIVEIANVSEIQSTDLTKLHPLTIHLAIECSNPEQEAQRLVVAGAEMIGESIRNEYKGEKILVRDPFGKLTIQVINRKSKLKDQ